MTGHVQDLWMKPGDNGRKVRADTGWHAVRHFHASLLISAGLSPRAVADRLGHSTVTQTLNTYAHLWGTDDAKSVAAIDAVLGGSADPDSD